jgi:hypothetical protein
MIGQNPYFHIQGATSIIGGVTGNVVIAPFGLDITTPPPSAWFHDFLNYDLHKFIF